MTDKDHSSFLDFGGYSNIYMADPSLFEWVPTETNAPWWSFYVQGFKIGNSPNISIYVSIITSWLIKGLRQA